MDIIPFVNWKTILTFSVKLLCPITGNEFFAVNFQSSNESFSQNDSIRGAIENFVNGNISVISVTRPLVKHECIVDISKLDHIEIQFSGAQAKLIEELFNNSSWDFIKPYLSF